MSLAESGSREPVVYIQAKGSSIRFRLDHADGVASRSCGHRSPSGGDGCRSARPAGAAAFAATGNEVGGVVEFVGPHRAARFPAVAPPRSVHNPNG